MLFFFVYNKAGEPYRVSTAKIVKLRQQRKPKQPVYFELIYFNLFHLFLEAKSSEGDGMKREIQLVRHTHTHLREMRNSFKYLWDDFTLLSINFLPCTRVHTSKLFHKLLYKL